MRVDFWSGTGPAAAPAHFPASASPCLKISALAPRHPFPSKNLPARLIYFHLFKDV